MARTTSEFKPRLSLVERFVPVLLLAVVGLAFGFGVLWQKVDNLQNSGVTAGTQTTGGTAGQQQQQVEVTLDQIKALFANEKLIRLGEANSKLLVAIVEDPSCPYCHIASGEDPELNKTAGAQFTTVADGGSYVPPVQELKKLVDAGDASMVYIYTPGHGNGEMGHKALLCANDEGKFWQAHDLLYSDKGYEILNGTDINNQAITGVIVKNDKTKSGDLANFLKAAVDPATMKSCLDSGKYDNSLSEEAAIAASLGVTGTPGFFLNTTRFAGAYSFTDMKSIVDAALQ